MFPGTLLSSSRLVLLIDGWKILSTKYRVHYILCRETRGGLGGCRGSHAFASKISHSRNPHTYMVSHTPKHRLYSPLFFEIMYAN